MEVPALGIEPVPWQRPEPQQWQHCILNPLCHKGTPRRAKSMESSKTITLGTGKDFLRDRQRCHIHRLEDPILLRSQFYPIRIVAGSFSKLDELILQFICISKRLSSAKTTWKQKNKVEELTLPNFKAYSKVSVTKTVWSWCRGRHINQWNSMESSEIDANRSSHCGAVG